MTCCICGLPHQWAAPRCSFCAAIIYLVSQVTDEDEVKEEDG